MRLLVLCPHYRPQENPRALRWTALCEAWAKEGWEVHLLCARNGCPPGKERINGVYVHRTGFSSLGACLQKSSSGRPGFASRPTSRSRLFRLHTYGWQQLYWPDGACLWYPGARHVALRLLKNQPFDALLSVSLPFTAHWVAYAVKKRYPALPWLVDIGDPFSFLHQAPKNNLRLYHRKNIRAERTVLRAADEVTLTHAGARDAYARYFPEATPKLRVIPPVFVPAKPFVGLPPPNPPPYLLAYFGSFYSGVREPDLLLNFLNGFLRQCPHWRDLLRVELYGPMEAEFRRQLQSAACWNKQLFYRGWLSRPKAWSRLRTSPFLLSLGNRTSSQLPSKAADYWMSRRPVVHLWQNERDAFAELFRSYPAFLSLNPHAFDAKKLVAFFEKGNQLFQMTEDWKAQVRAFSLPSVAEAYSERIRSISQGKTPD